MIGLNVTKWDPAPRERTVHSVEDIRTLAMCSTTRGVVARGGGMTYVAYPEHVQMGAGEHGTVAVTSYYYDDLTDKVRRRMTKLTWTPTSNGGWESPLKALSRAAE